MAQVTIDRSVSSDEVATTLRNGLGEGAEVKTEGDHLAVKASYWKRAKVTVHSSGETTAVEVKTSAPPGLIGMAIAMLLNSRNFVPRVAQIVETGLK